MVDLESCWEFRKLSQDLVAESQNRASFRAPEKFWNLQTTTDAEILWLEFPKSFLLGHVFSISMSSPFHTFSSFISRFRVIHWNWCHQESHAAFLNFSRWISIWIAFLNLFILFFSLTVSLKVWNYRRTRKHHQDSTFVIFWNSTRTNSRKKIVQSNQRKPTRKNNRKTVKTHQAKLSDHHANIDERRHQLVNMKSQQNHNLLKKLRRQSNIKKKISTRRQINSIISIYSAKRCTNILNFSTIIQPWGRGSIITVSFWVSKFPLQINDALMRHPKVEFSASHLHDFMV